MAIADASLTSLRFAKEATSEISTITANATPATAGTFTITVNAVVSGTIVFNATAAQVQTALEAMANVDPGDVSCADSGPGANLGTGNHVCTITWGGRYQGYDPAISIQTGGLTGNPHALATTQFGGVADYGNSPTGTTAYQEVRMVSESLGQDKEVVQSDEILTDRRPPDNIQVGSSGSGDVVTEVIGGGFNAGPQRAYDDWLLASIGQNVPFIVTAADTTFSSGTITVDNVSTDRISFVCSAGSFGAGLLAGVFVQVTGFINDSTGASLTYLNSTYMVISGAGTSTLTCTKGPRVAASPAPPRTTPTLTGGTTVRFRRYPDAVDGTSLATFTLERKYSITNEFARMPGYALQGFRFEMRPKQPMRFTWNWIGKEETSATTALSSVVLAAPTNKSFAPVGDFRSLSIGEDGRSFSVTSFTLQVSGGLYPQDEEAGVLGPQGIGLGTFDVTGSIEFYYEGGSLFSFYQQFTDKSLHFAATNAAGDGLLFAMPRVNLTSPSRRSIAGKDQAVKGSVSFRAAKGTEVVGGATYLLKIGRI